MELEKPTSIRFTKDMINDINVYRISKLPPLSFSEATRALIKSALEEKETTNETS